MTEEVKRGSSRAFSLRMIHEPDEPKRNQTESAKRTPENSPAIYRWERSAEVQPKSAKRTTETFRNRLTLRFSVARFTGFVGGIQLFPALKCWAIFKSSAARTLMTNASQ